MDNDFLKNCLQEIFTDKNIKIIWANRDNNEEIISLDATLPIRYKKNKSNGRNVEIVFNSKSGDFYSTLFIVEQDKFYFPDNVYKLAKRFLMNYEKINEISFSFRREYQILMGAFSVESYYQANKNIDVESYFSYGIEFEIIKANDGTLQTFTKESNMDLIRFSSLHKLEKTSLDGVAVSSFFIENSYLKLNVTLESKDWVEILKKKRLLELYTI